MVQFLSINFFSWISSFLLGFSKVPVFCVTLYVSLTTLPSLFVGSFSSLSDQTPAFPFVSDVPQFFVLFSTYCIILSLRLFLSFPYSTIL